MFVLWTSEEWEKWIVTREDLKKGCQKTKKDKVRVAWWCWGEDWCPHLLDRLVHGRLVSANGE
jgi:hypothetical protein